MIQLNLPLCRYVQKYHNAKVDAFDAIYKRFIYIFFKHLVYAAFLRTES